MEKTIKAAFMKDHQCRLCLYYDTCSHEYCKVDGSSLPREEGSKKKATSEKIQKDR